MVVNKIVLEFEWDKGNIEKNRKHGVEDREAEEAFLDEYKKTFKDHLHSAGEERFRIIGKTKKGKLLFIAFTIRKTKIRVISARKVNKRELALYE